MIDSMKDNENRGDTFAELKKRMAKYAERWGKIGKQHARRQTSSTARGCKECQMQKARNNPEHGGDRRPRKDWQAFRKHDNRVDHAARGQTRPERAAARPNV